MLTGDKGGGPSVGRICVTVLPWDAGGRLCDISLAERSHVSFLTVGMWGHTTRSSPHVQTKKGVEKGNDVIIT